MTIELNFPTSEVEHPALWISKSSFGGLGGTILWALAADLSVWVGARRHQISSAFGPTIVTVRP